MTPSTFSECASTDQGLIHFHMLDGAAFDAILISSTAPSNPDAGHSEIQLLAPRTARVR
jgi:hypothetical protein